jgi:hypothetical protein
LFRGSDGQLKIQQLLVGMFSDDGNIQQQKEKATEFRVGKLNWGQFLK